MEFYLEGLRQDLKLEKEQVGSFFREYYDLNRPFLQEDKYEGILLNYGTQELKFTLGFLTNIYRQLEKKGYPVIDSIFDVVEHSGEFGLSVFFGNRILEKYTSDEPEHCLIRINTLRRMLNALTVMDDRLNFLKYLLRFIDEIENFLNRYPAYRKENFKNGVDLYQFLYIYGLKLVSDEEKSLGYLIKAYNMKKVMIDEGMLPYPEENNIFQIINIVGSYLQIEDSFIALVLDIDRYILEFVKQVKDLKEYAAKKPSVLTPYLQNPFKKYINQFLTNLYILGFEEEYRAVISTFPEIITNDHRLIVKINETVMVGINREKEILKIKEEIEKAFNNFSEDKKESVLYVYYNGYISIFKEDRERIASVIKEIELFRKKLKNAFSLNVPLFRALNIIGKKKEAINLASETKQQAVISGRKFLASAVDTYLKTEF